MNASASASGPSMCPARQFPTGSQTFGFGDSMGIRLPEVSSPQSRPPPERN
jgi:hypothetical protein